MKILFIQPPIEDYYDTGIRTYPLGLLYLAKKVESLADVKIIDFRTYIKPKQAKNPFPELSEYYKENLYSPFSLFKKYNRFGSSEEDMKKRIESEKPNIICISSLFSAYAEEALNIARIAKEIDRDIITVLGGTHPTSLPEEVLKNQNVDFVIRGEGETPLYNLIHKLKNGDLHCLRDINGLCFKSKEEFFISPLNIERDLNTIPARNLVNADNYRIGKKRYTFFLISRGCPFRCAFCGRLPVPFRKKSLKTIEEELEECLNLGIEWIDFEDDMLTYDVNHFRETLKIFSGKNLILSAMNGIYSETLNKVIVKEMIEAGFKRINLSIVDLSTSILKIQKRFSSNTFFEILPYLESTELLMEVHFIVGLPQQSLKHILDTMIFLSGRRCLLGPSAFYVVPKIDACEMVLGSNWKEKMKYMRSSVLIPVNPDLSRTTLFTVMKLARFINFLKSLADKYGSMDVSEIKNTPFELSNNNIIKEIFTALINEKRFMAYDKEKKTFVYEPCDEQAVKYFFEEIKKKTVRGYKTNSVITFEEI
ncbi:MAG TPA: cobalamin-dependent protein [Syntrophorhabdaceae bacterium]|nr:cobalamin-dependent protein [Syntrophorhabdaceae bacterium]